MPTREEYLLKHQDRLLEKLSTSFGTFNKNVVACFSLLTVFLLYRYNLVKEASVEGNSLNITADQARIFFPLIICIPYLLINNTIYRITDIVTLLKQNSAELLRINPEARPFIVADLHYETDGLPGLQLSLSRKIVRYAAKGSFTYTVGFPKLSNPIAFVKALWTGIKVTKKASADVRELFILGIGAVLIYLIPLLVPGFIVYHDKLSVLVDGGKYLAILKSPFFYELLIVAAIVVYTIVANIFLYSFYFEEITTLKNKVMENIITGDGTIEKKFVAWVTKDNKKNEPEKKQ